MGGFPRDCVISSSLLCAHRWSSQVQFQMWEEMKAFLLVLTHSSMNERGHDICAEEHMAMTVKCSSPEERLRGTLMVVWVSQQPQGLVKLLNPQGSLVDTLMCAVGIHHNKLYNLP